MKNYQIKPFAGAAKATVIERLPSLVRRLGVLEKLHPEPAARTHICLGGDLEKAGACLAIQVGAESTVASITLVSPLSNSRLPDRSPAAGGRASDCRRFRVVGSHRLSATQSPRISWMGAALHRCRPRGGDAARCRSHRSLEAQRLPHPAQGCLKSGTPPPNPSMIF